MSFSGNTLKSPRFALLFYYTAKPSLAFQIIPKKYCKLDIVKQIKVCYNYLTGKSFGSIYCREAKKYKRGTTVTQNKCENIVGAAEKEKKWAAFLRKNLTVFFGAMICCALWGSAFPCVKLGMDMFGIAASQPADVVLFAGIRFTLAGLFVVIIGSISEKRVLIPSGAQCGKILKLCLFQTVGQYSFYYIGLAHSTGVNTSIVDSLAYFFSIIAACVFFRIENLDFRKTIGCVLGFLGVILVNVSSSGFELNMTFIGEGMVLISAVCYSISSVLAKLYSKDDNPVLLSGYQFMVGGILLILGGLAFGGGIRKISAEAVIMLIYLALISTIAYTLWTVLLKYNDVSKVSIYGFMNPIFGVLFSVIILGETQAISIKYLAALVTVSVGIALVNGKLPEKRKRQT